MKQGLQLLTSTAYKTGFLMFLMCAWVSSQFRSSIKQNESWILLDENVGFLPSSWREQEEYLTPTYAAMLLTGKATDIQQQSFLWSLEAERELDAFQYWMIL